MGFRSAATAANGAAPVSLTVTKPAGTVDDDVMVAFVTISADKTIAAAPAGWTLLDERNTGTATGDCRTAVYYKVAASEGSSYVWDFSGGADAAAVILAYEDISTDAPVNVSGYRLMGSSLTQTAPSVTPGTADTITITAYGTNPVFNGDTTFTTPSGLTARAEADPGAGTTNRAVLKVFDKVTAVAEATGDKATTLNNSAKGVAFTVTLAPFAAAELAVTVSPYRVVATATGCMLGWSDQNGYSGTNGLTDMEDLLDTHFSAVRIYHTVNQWGEVSNQVSTAIDDGRLPVVSHKLPKVANAWVAFHSTTTYDAGLDALVDAYKEFAPTEVVAIFHHEPYGNSASGSQTPTLGKTSDFVKAFRKFAKAFKDAGADHVKIGYCEVDSRARAYPNDPCYPGDDAADVLCHDVYNWGNYAGHSWEEPDDMLAGIVTDAKAANKALIIGELGCHPGGYSGHDRAVWLADLATYLKTDPDASTYIIGFCYYHSDSHGGSGHFWRFAQGDTSSAAQRTAYTTNFSHDSYFLADPISPSLRGATADPGGLGEQAPSGGTPPSVQGTMWSRKTTVDGVNITEVSGVASSPKGGAWAIRDSGNPASLYWLTQTSRGNFAAHEVAVTSATNSDWEDCIYTVESGVAYVYIHDNRDGNSAGANPKRLYKVAEPATPSAASSVAITATYHWKFPASASSSTCGSKQNCEAIAIFKGRLYGVQKTDAAEAQVYDLGPVGSLSTNSASPTEGTLVGTIGTHCPSCFSISADGTTVVTIQHGETEVWRGKGDTITSLLTGRNTRVYLDNPGGSGEGADWFPYQSADFLVISEDKQTFDYDVSVGSVLTSGIASTVAFGTPTVTIGGDQAILSAGAIFAPGDYLAPEEDPGIDFGIPIVTFETPPSPTPSLEGSFYFEGPTVDDVPPVPPDWLPIPVLPSGRPEQRLFAHFKNRARGRTVILLTSGDAFAVDYPTQMVPAWQDQGDPFTETGLAGYAYTDIARVFLGGHIDIVDSDEAELLTAAGFGDGLTPIPEPPPSELRWGALAGGTWEDFATNYSTWGG